MQAEAGEAEIDRQGLVELGAAVVEQIGGIGDRRRDAVADRVDRHRALVEMAEMEQLQPELASVGAKKSLVGAKPDVAPGIEIELAQRFWKRRQTPCRNGAAARSRARRTTSSKSNFGGGACGLPGSASAELLIGCQSRRSNEIFDQRAALDIGHGGPKMEGSCAVLSADGAAHGVTQPFAQAASGSSAFLRACPPRSSCRAGREAPARREGVYSCGRWVLSKV